MTFETFLEVNKGQIWQDLSGLIRIDTTRDVHTISEEKPFGNGIHNGFSFIEEMAKRDKLHYFNADGYAAHIEVGNSGNIIGILCHVDIVGIFNPEKWHTDPFELREKGHEWFGRGVNDDKGPLIMCYYLMLYLKHHMKSKNRIRLIIGGAEETTWQCMDHYKEICESPIVSFSPDGNFPVVNCEKGIGYHEFILEHFKDHIGGTSQVTIKGINCDADKGKVCDQLQVQIKCLDSKLLEQYITAEHATINNVTTISYEGVSAKSRSPQKGYNAVWHFTSDFMKLSKGNYLGGDDMKLVKLLHEYFYECRDGSKLGLYNNDPETGETTSNIYALKYKNKLSHIKFDIRFPMGIEAMAIEKRLKHISIEEHVRYNIIDSKRRLYVPRDSQLLKILGKAYLETIGETLTFSTKGAASYARVFENSVSFGPTFQGKNTNSHSSNENVNVEDLFTATKLYYETIRLLECAYESKNITNNKDINNL